MYCLFSKGAEIYSEADFEKTRFVDLADYKQKLGQADVVVLCLGELPSTEKPGDILSLNLAPEQIELAKLAYEQKKKVILVLLEARPRIIHDIVAPAAAIIQGYLPGDYGAEALVQLMYGENNFSGKLPYTYPKFDGVIEQGNSRETFGDPQGFGRMEYAYYLMAQAAGITMMESQLKKENHRAHFMTKRFDRLNNQKLHTQTLCGLAHFDYNMPGAYSYEQAFQIMRQMQLPYTDMEELFRRMVFNIMARNQDDHTKNISFLMNPGGKWSLSPAYDITFAYNPSNFWLKSHQMTINGKKDDLNLTDVLTVAKNVHLKKPTQLIQECREAIVRWGEFADAAFINSEQQAEIKGFFNLLM